jgi:hypothetical protein
MSVNIPLPDKSTVNVPTMAEHQALMARVATLEAFQQQTERTNATRNQRGPAANEVRTGTTTGPVSGAGAQTERPTPAQVQAGAAQTPHATPPVAARPAPPVQHAAPPKT